MLLYQNARYPLFFSLSDRTMAAGAAGGWLRVGVVNGIISSGPGPQRRVLRGTSYWNGNAVRARERGGRKRDGEREEGRAYRLGV